MGPAVTYRGGNPEMAEPSSLSSFSPLSAHPVARGPRLPHGLHQSLRPSFEEDILDVRPAVKPGRARRRPHPPAGISRTGAPSISVPAEAIPYREYREPEPDAVPRERSAKRPPAEKTLRAALLAGLCLNLIAFLMVGLSLPNGELTRNDALLAAATLLPALIMLLVGEFCRQDGRQDGRQGDSAD